MITDLTLYLLCNSPRFHERLVITGVVFQLLLIDVDNISANAIEEILRVGDYDENPFISFEFLL